ncbi:MAG: DUF1513 domain-containing protein [Myxococcales bacterium]|nr:DUF1513 domain-containing protein [Myxococcales bacterium]
MRGTIIGGGSFVKDGQQAFSLTLVDLDADERKARLIPTSFLPHAIAVDPQQPNRVAVFEKKGPGACLIDLGEARVLAPITTPPERHFYGHGAFSLAGDVLYTTESYLEDAHRGALVVRDRDSLQELGTVPTFGASPHDCLMLDDGKTMVITNGGGPLRGGSPPSVTYVDLPSGKLLEEVRLSAPRFNTGHLTISKRGDLAVVSAPRDGLPATSPSLGAVSLKAAGKPIVTMRKPKKVVERMRGETLSVLIVEPTHSVYATHPEGNMLTRWSLDDVKLSRRYDDFEQPRGICLTLDGRSIVVGHSVGSSVALSFLDATTGDLLPDQRIQPSFITGSHVFAHAIAA